MLPPADAFLFLGDDFNAGVSEKGGKWTAPRWISGGFETAMLWPLDGVLFTSPKHTLGSSLKGGEPLGMTWGHPWPEELLRKPACGRYFEAGGPATGSRILQSGMLLGYQRGGKTCLLRDDTVTGVREALEHCGASLWS